MGYRQYVQIRVESRGFPFSCRGRGHGRVCVCDRAVCTFLRSLPFYGMKCLDVWTVGAVFALI